MGEDIHQKNFIKSKITKKYTSWTDVDFGIEGNEMFPVLMDYRSYVVFSVFGSSRGDFYPMSDSEIYLSDLKDDMPTEYALHQQHGLNWYRYSIFTFKDLREKIKKYIWKLKNPLRYFPKDTDEYLDAKDGTFKKYHPCWKEDSECVSSALSEMLVKLDKAEKFYNEYKDVVGPLFDINESLYMFWFDS